MLPGVGAVSAGLLAAAGSLQSPRRFQAVAGQAHRVQGATEVREGMACIARLKAQQAPVVGHLDLAEYITDGRVAAHGII